MRLVAAILDSAGLEIWPVVQTIFPWLSSSFGKVWSWFKEATEAHP